MIDHIVLLRPRPGLTDEDVATMRSSVLGLADRIPGIVEVVWGPNVSIEGLGQGHDLGFVVRFTDAAARDAYLPHPEHLAVVPELVSRTDGILVFDLDRAG